MSVIINILNKSDMETTHKWDQLPHITDDIVSQLIDKINSKQFTPRNVYNYIKGMKLYVTSEQLRTIQSACSHLYSNYSMWYLYDHALCSLVTDRWNLTPRYNAEGYYYCSIEQANKLQEPPYNWNAMQLDEPFF